MNGENISNTPNPTVDEAYVDQYYKPTVKEKISYGFGDVAHNLANGMVFSLITLFYTDYVGASPAVAGAVLLISQIFDGVSDFTMGIIVDRTKSKHGKARLWLLRMAIPYGISMILLVTVPQTNEVAQFIYMLVTYNLVTTVCYTALNVPYGTLANLITRDSNERAILGVFRMGMSPFGRILSVSLSLPLIQLFGDNQMAWVYAMTIWAILSVILFFICFKNTEERVKIESVEKNKVTLKQNLKALFANKYFYIILILWTVQASYNQMFGTIGPYYSQYILGNITSVYSIMYFIETIVLIIGVLSSASLIRKFGKRNLALTGSVIVIIAQLLIYVNPYSTGWVLFLTIFRSLGTVPLNATIMGMIGDVIEYGQWRTHVRQESIIVSAGSTGVKLGQGLAGGAVGFLLQYAGYASSTGGAGAVTQSAEALSMIQNLFIWGPIVIWLIALIALLFYHLDKNYPQIIKELHERESRGEV